LPTSRAAAPRRIGAIEVGFRLIRVLESADGPLSLKDLSERAGMPPSKAYAYVASFVHEGMLAQDPATGHYGLGPFALYLGVAALRQSDLVDIVRREAPALSEATTCSVMLSTWGNRGPTIVHRVDGKERGPTSIRVGYVTPLWRSATGRVFIAYLTEAETTPILRSEEGDGVSAGEIRASSERVRAEGFALGDDDGYLSGIAAPILDHDAHLAAVLTLSRPFEGNTRERRIELGHVLREATAGMSRRLGYVSPAARPARTAKGALARTQKRIAPNTI
jgi:DNA-binding IclR family transcriptional regulator